MDSIKLRAWWFARQGLDGSLAGATPAAVLERCGWSRSVGGVGPYLTLFARAGTARQAADDAAAAQVVEVLGEDHGATITVVEGGPAETLVAAAADADLVVVGNRGRGNLAAALLGSTSAKVADESPCPVVVVRAHSEP